MSPEMNADRYSYVCASLTLLEGILEEEEEEGKKKNRERPFDQILK